MYATRGISLVVSISILAIVYTWIFGWVADVLDYLKVRSGNVEAQSQLEIVVETTFDNSQSRMEEDRNESRNPIMNCSESHMAGSILVKSNELTFKSIHDIIKVTNSVQTMTENSLDSTNKSSLNTQIDMIAGSLEHVYKKLEKMEQNNTTQFRRIIGTEKRVKELGEATKIELQGIRRRFESFEKKSL